MVDFMYQCACTTGCFRYLVKQYSGCFCVAGNDTQWRKLDTQGNFVRGRRIYYWQSAWDFNSTKAWAPLGQISYSIYTSAASMQEECDSFVWGSTCTSQLTMGGGVSGGGCKGEGIPGHQFYLFTDHFSCMYEKSFQKAIQRAIGYGYFITGWVGHFVSPSLFISQMPPLLFGWN